MQKKGNIICIIIVLILCIPSTILFGIEAIQSGDLTLFIISSIVDSVLIFIYVYVTKDVIDSKFATKNT